MEPRLNIVKYVKCVARNENMLSNYSSKAAIRWIGDYLQTSYFTCNDA